MIKGFFDLQTHRNIPVLPVSYSIEAVIWKSNSGLNLI